MDQNLTTVQWGLLSVFGVVVTLLIPHADQYYRAFLASGADEDQRQAARWAGRIKLTAWIVLGALFLLSAVGAYDAGLVSLVPPTSAISSGSRWLGVLVVDGGRPRSGVATWLLFAPVLAQIGFLCLVVGLVRRVPEIRELPLDPPAPLRPSPRGQGPATVIRFVNESEADVAVRWLDFNGYTPQYLVIPPGKEGTQPTFAGHLFLVVGEKRGRLHIVAAAATPGKVVIK